MTARSPSRIWLEWIVANAFGEAVGLGCVGLMAMTAMVAEPELAERLPRGALAAAVIALGTVEGIIVGLCQGLVLRRAIGRFKPRAWLLATALGALAAWTLGMLPSTLLHLGGEGGGGSPAALSDGLQLVLAAGLGLVAGPLLALFQWPVLRRHLARAALWLPANALAWAAGMPIVFWVAREPPEPGAPYVLRLLGTLFCAGAVVGAIHGAFLVRLLRATPDRPG